MSQEDADCAVVRRNLEAVARQDFAALAATLAPDVVQHYQRPTARRDDGGLMSGALVGRDNILAEIRDNFYVTLYRPGTARISIERMVSAGGFVAVQFSLSATVLRTGEDYENFYFFLYRVQDGRIAEYWEYLDTAYATAKLFATAG